MHVDRRYTYAGSLRKIARLRSAFDFLAHPTLVQPRDELGRLVWELHVENTTQAFRDSACDRSKFWSRDE